jgi:2Fe-2S ferredoxin
MPKITFLPEGIEIETSEGETLLDVALDNDIELDHNCGGNCACSTCHVIVESGLERLNPISGDEDEMLEEADGLTKKSRLSCQCVVNGDLTVRIPAGRVL